MMGQLYCGSVFSRKWNKAWESEWQSHAGSLFDLSIDDIPQQEFNDLLSITFYAVVDSHFSGRIPKRVQAFCTVPDRTSRSLQDIIDTIREKPSGR